MSCLLLEVLLRLLLALAIITTAVLQYSHATNHGGIK